MLDAWGLQALSAAALVIAGECECCVPPFPLQRGPLHTTQCRAHAHKPYMHANSAAAPPQDAGRPSQWWCRCCCTALQAVQLGAGAALALGLARQCRRVAANDHRCWLRAGVSLVLVLALCVPVLGLKGQFRRLVDENGAIPHLSCPSLHFAAPSLECFLVQICIFAQHILPCVQ